ncbi:hypothetical protein [Kineococcus sp. NPDC059986]|uniref:hypothetical protein n=1 Tax=Kineococcus sp. NPDC059986 TaxID=3155538 RepID=UPI00345047C0
MAKVSTFTDDFSSARTDLWDTISTKSPNITIVSGQLKVLTTQTGMQGVTTWDLTESQWAMQVAARPADSGWVATSLDWSGGYTAEWRISGTNTWSYDGTTLTDHGTSIATPWVRIRETGGQLFWEWSSDGISWTTVRQVATTTGATTVRPSVYTSSNRGTNSFVLLDNVNILPNPITLSAASNMTAAAVVSKLGVVSQSAASNLTATGQMTATGVSSLSAASAFTADGSITQRDWVNVGFDSASDLNLFTQSGFSVANSAASANVAANGDLDSLFSTASADMTNGTFVTEVNLTENGNGVYGLIGLRSGTNEVGFFFDGYGLLAKTRSGGSDVDSNYIGQYLVANHAWLRIVVTGGVPVASYSGDGSTWTQAPGTLQGLSTGSWTSATTEHTLGAYASTNFNMVVKSARMYGPLPPQTVNGGSLGFSGASGLAVAALVEAMASTSLSASGGLTVAGGVLQSIDSGLIPLSASSGLQAGGQLEQFGAAVLSAEGILVAAAKDPVVVLGDAQLDGSGDLDADAWLEVLGEAELDLRLYSGIEVYAQVYPIRWRLTTPSRRVPHKGKGRFSPHVQGLSLVKDQGFWKTVEMIEDFAAYQTVYLGGYKHWITKAEYDELVTAGYGAYVEVVLPQVPADPTTTGFGSGSFGSGPFGVGTGSQAYGAGSYSANSYQEGT